MGGSEGGHFSLYPCSAMYWSTISGIESAAAARPSWRANTLASETRQRADHVTSSAVLTETMMSRVLLSVTANSAAARPQQATDANDTHRVIS